MISGKAPFATAALSDSSDIAFSCQRSRNAFQEVRGQSDLVDPIQASSLTCGHRLQNKRTFKYQRGCSASIWTCTEVDCSTAPRTFSELDRPVLASPEPNRFSFYPRTGTSNSRVTSVL